jgi:hypothetical protein
MGSGSRSAGRDPWPTLASIAAIICWISWIPLTVHSALPPGSFIFFLSLVNKFGFYQEISICDGRRDILTGARLSPRKNVS